MEQAIAERALDATGGATHTPGSGTDTDGLDQNEYVLDRTLVQSRANRINTVRRTLLSQASMTWLKAFTSRSERLAGKAPRGGSCKKWVTFR
jgi:hypothetical protein